MTRTFRRAVVIGLDGFEPGITERLLAAGRLPNLSRLAARAGMHRLQTTAPAQTPVAWSSFATGLDPAGHGILDFLARDPASYRIDQGLFRWDPGSALRPPSVRARRRGTPIWSRLGEAGIRSTVIRCPCTYPPDEVSGRLLSGMGVPDLRGSFGTPTWFTTRDDPAREGERVALLRQDRQEWVGVLEGPRLTAEGPTAIEVRLAVHDGVEDRVSVRLGARVEVEARKGEWSTWLRAHFRAGRLRSERGIVRVLWLGTAEAPELYVTAVHMDPDAPGQSISTPWSFAGALATDIGLFGTAGFVEEHVGLMAGRLSEDDFLAQCELTHREREAMLRAALDRDEDGLLYCLFDTPDRVQHLFWRFLEPDHPANRRHPAASGAFASVIDEWYVRCDQSVGMVLDAMDEGTVVFVLSDHGFNTYRRQLHLNDWLVANGWMTLKGGAERCGAATELLADVDWTQTRAYALGLGGVFLNLAGRERDGVVPAADRWAVAAELAEGLSRFGEGTDDAGSVRRAAVAAALYESEAGDDVPEVLVLPAPGCRVSPATALGGRGGTLAEDNTSRWSGDHVVAPECVPGVLLASHPLAGDAPRLVDLAPSLLAVFGVPAGDLPGRRLVA